MAMINRRQFVKQPDMMQGWTSPGPMPTRIVSNEEFPPLPQTEEQCRVEQALATLGERASHQLGISRRKFLKTTGGMAAAFVAMNSVFGRFFEVRDVELMEAAAFAEQGGDPYFIFDVQTHYVSAGYDPRDEESDRKGAVTKHGLLGLRKRARDMGVNPRLQADTGTLQDLSWENFIREVFLDSETSLGLISTPPGPYPQLAVVPPKEMTHIRDEINRVAGSQRMLAHGLVTPQLGRTDRDFMEQQVHALKIDAWKGYTGSAPKGHAEGWWMDDEKVAYPMLEKARELGVPRVCVHKGLPLGPVEDYNHPRDLIKAALDFPDIQFIVYHSGFRGLAGLKETFARTGDIPWTSEFCRMKRANPKIGNIYMELGSTFGQLVSSQPSLCAHLLGEIIGAFGADHVLWGTDSIWYGTPQWQIEAFKRFQIPDEMLEQKSYRPLTREVKTQIFGLNAARLFDIDVDAQRHALPKDVLSHIKMAYQQEGPTPTHRFYGWVVR
ncbi:MAG: amidohydrolase family protein [Nitrospirales bacterium]|nr:amidohydrolase family protein [Nitrospirales bacterium]